MNKWNKLRRQNLGTIPQEASINLNAPETAPSRPTNKVNIRTKPLNFKVSEEFYWQLKDLALKEKSLMVEIVEKALASYKRERTILPNSSTDLASNFPKKEAIKTKPSATNQEVKELSEKYCSFFGQDEKTQTIIYLTCDKPLFDKKKRLCHSHSRQVRNKFR